MTDRLQEIRARWQRLADVPIKGNLDFARLGEQAKADVPVLLELLQERPPLGYVVLAKSRTVDGGWRYHVGSAIRVQQSAEDAAKLRAAPSDEYVYVVAEVREVQP